MTPREATRACRTVPCPRCGVPANELCKRDYGFATVSIHAGRRAEAVRLGIVKATAAETKPEGPGRRRPDAS